MHMFYITPQLEAVKSAMKLQIRVVLTLVAVGCADLGEPVTPLPPEISVVELLAVPDSIVVAGRTLKLSTYLWRDFMPMSPPAGRPLQGAFYVSASDTARLPADLSADAVWLVYGNEIWRDWLDTPTVPPGDVKPSQIYCTVGHGPYWGPQVAVDAIVRVTSGSSGSHLLRAPNQTIHRTD
jgi:hypothetical protein